jgi:tetratricopeptide (TPR) repeat protein
MILSSIALLMAPLQPPLGPSTSNRQACTALPASPSNGDAAELAQQAAAAMSAGDLARAERLARDALAGTGDVARARALRLLIDLQLPTGDVREAEAILACDALTGDAWTHARAWLAYRQERYLDAVRLLQPLTRPRHHTLPRWPIVHEDLGDSYLRLGRTADAQAQWRIALATDHGPSGTGWDRAALERKLADAVSGPAGAAPMLPLQYHADAVAILDAASVRRTEAGVRYDKLILLQNDARGAAYGIDSWEVRCDGRDSRVLGVRTFTADGTPVGTDDAPSSWRPDLPGEPWLPTERALVCAMDPGQRLAPRRRTDAELLHAYRAGETLFD